MTDIHDIDIAIRTYDWKLIDTNADPSDPVKLYDRSIIFSDKTYTEDCHFWVERMKEIGEKYSVFECLQRKLVVVCSTLNENVRKREIYENSTYSTQERFKPTKSINTDCEPLSELSIHWPRYIRKKPRIESW